jgi:hypothetical protein
MSRMAESLVLVRVLSDDELIRHLDPELVHQEGASLAATIQTTRIQNQSSPTSLKETHNDLATASTNANPRSQILYIDGNPPKQLYSLEPPSVGGRASISKSKILSGSQLVGYLISGAPEHRKSETSRFSASTVDESAHVRRRSRESTQLGHVTVSPRELNPS